MIMRVKIMLAVTASILYVSCTSSQQGLPEAELDTQLDSLSYALGVTFGNNLASTPIEDIDVQLLARGFSDAFSEGDTTKLDAMQANELIQRVFAELTLVQNQKNLEEGEEFLAKNKKKKGVETTESGLQYKVLEEGDGPIPEEDDQVRVHYHGTLLDGTVFDSSVERGEPVEFKLNQVISGWTEALTMMPVGSKWKLFIPTGLAYGTRVRPGSVIEPNMALVFEVELLDITNEEEQDNDQN